MPWLAEICGRPASSEEKEVERNVGGGGEELEGRD